MEELIHVETYLVLQYLVVLIAKTVNYRGLEVAGEFRDLRPGFVLSATVLANIVMNSFRPVSKYCFPCKIPNRGTSWNRKKRVAYAIVVLGEPRIRTQFLLRH